MDNLIERRKYKIRLAVASKAFKTFGEKRRRPDGPERIVWSGLCDEEFDARQLDAWPNKADHFVRQGLAASRRDLSSPSAGLAVDGAALNLSPSRSNNSLADLPCATTGEAEA